ncbi:PAS domain S-box protein [bacterium]|nr:PAS domain S-box protein [bacterium]
MNQKKKIIYIDSEASFRKNAEEAFQQSDYQCVLCETGSTGLLAIGQMKPNVVLVDNQLNDCSGEDLYTDFLSQPQFKDLHQVPFIILTRNGEDRSRLYSLGFSACLSKPFSSKALVEFVEDVMISHQIKMEEVYCWETIREAKDFLERVVESSIDAIVTTDTRGIITYCNRSCEEMLGCSFEDLVGVRVSHFLELGTSELIKISTFLKKKKKIQNYKTILVAQNNQRIPINLSVSTMRSNDGKIMGALGIAKALGSNNFAEYDTHESDRMTAVVETAVAVNHAVNNPLVPILGNAQFLLQDERIDDEDVRKRLRIIVKNALRIRDITQKLASITHPVTKEYLKGTRMLDIDGST